VKILLSYNMVNMQPHSMLSLTQNLPSRGLAEAVMVSVNIRNIREIGA